MLMNERTHGLIVTLTFFVILFFLLHWYNMSFMLKFFLFTNFKGNEMGIRLG